MFTFLSSSLLFNQYLLAIHDVHTTLQLGYALTCDVVNLNTVNCQLSILNGLDACCIAEAERNEFLNACTRIIVCLETYHI